MIFTFEIWRICAGRSIYLEGIEGINLKVRTSNMPERRCKLKLYSDISGFTGVAFYTEFNRFSIGELFAIASPRTDMIYSYRRSKSSLHENDYRSDRVVEYFRSVRRWVKLLSC